MADLNELEKLNELKNKGIISQEEFDAQKAKILSSLNQPSAGGKSQVAYCVLALFLGSWGIHNFYAGRWKRGLTQLILTLSSFLTLFIGNIISILWSTINIFTIHTDGKGKEFQPSPTAKYICGIFSILWVLLILGVLALGGIAGYNMAMNRHRTNQMEDLATRLAIASQTYENTNTNNTYQ